MIKTKMIKTTVKTTEVEVTEQLFCDECGEEIPLVFPEPRSITNQGLHALGVRFDGGYGMFIDPLVQPGNDFLFCEACKDCKYIKKVKFFSFTGALCTHPRSTNLIYPDNFLVEGGEPEKKYQTCVTMRMDGNSNRCQREGAFFEAKTISGKIIQVTKKLDRC